MSGSGQARASASPPDLYATLGLSAHAGAADIKRAYRKLARQYHPDLNKAPQAEARFKDIAHAHKVLHDPVLRAAYDKERRQAREAASRPQHGYGQAPEGAQATAEDDFFSSLFAQAMRSGHGPDPRHRSSPPGPQPGADEHARILVDLEDTFHGAVKTIGISVMSPDGRRPGPDRQLEVRIPKGIQAGQRLRLAGQGGEGLRGGAHGDLFLEVAVRPHRQFHLQGRDVLVDLAVSPWEAALGATVEAPTPAGPVQLSVPPGSKPGRKLRLQGRGVPSQTPGDLYVVLQLALPPADTDEARQAYEALSQAFAHFKPRALPAAAPRHA
jgi:curved DNA-binding protein